VDHPPFKPEPEVTDTGTGTGVPKPPITGGTGQVGTGGETGQVEPL